MNYKKLIAGMLLITAVVTISAFINNIGDYPIQKIAEQLNKWKENYPVEKAYLQFDKPYYAVGDDIWFKAYVTIGNEHRLSAMSGNLTVELIDDKDSVKNRIKLMLIAGTAHGDFALPDTMQEGNYRIRAYTNYMRNAGEDYFFDKVITIVNSTTNKVFTKTNYTYSVQNGLKQVNATINYTDLNAIPYANKDVRFSITVNTKSLLKGKGITDNNGNLTISFANPNPARLNTGRITTILKLDNKNTVTKIVLIKAVSADVDVQFFPESGNLVNGIYSKVAFKAIGADGLGANIKGTIVDEQHNTIATFNSAHLGMGLFSMEPQLGRSYKANITFEDGSEKTIELPKAIDKGFVLAIDNSRPDSINIKVSVSHQMLVEDPNDNISVIAQSGGQIYLAASTKINSASFIKSLSKEKFPSGIVQFTLFSSKGEPLNERLVFIQTLDQLKLQVNTDKQTYAPREKVKINLTAENNELKPVNGSFSVTVLDETKCPFDETDESTILSNLLLTEDLKGYVEKPNYYFTNTNDKTSENLDILMLTQGYRRFEWTKILKDDFTPIIYHPEKAMQISGHIKTLGGKPVPHSKVMLLSTVGTFLLDTITDEQGNFAFKNLVFKDSIRFVIQARTDKNRKNVQIELDSINPQNVTQNKNEPQMQVNISNGLSLYLKNSKIFYDAQLKNGFGNHVLKEVIVKATRIRADNSSNLNGAGNADQVLTGDQFSGCPTIVGCLQGRLFGVIFRNGIPYSTRGGIMTISVDGVFMPSDEFESLNMDDVASVEVLRTPFYYSIYGAQSGPGGVILITLKRGSENTAYLSRPALGIITCSPKGYYSAREFYSPKYDDPKTNITLADLRSTIYWNPNIITDSNGKASFVFFNSGSKGSYKVIVEGIDVNGNLGRQIYHYKVE